MRLKRIRAGLYRTIDGRFDIIKDPSDWGYVSWLIFENGDPEPEWLDGTMLHESLRVARSRLEKAAYKPQQ